MSTFAPRLHSRLHPKHTLENFHFQSSITLSVMTPHTKCSPDNASIHHRCERDTITWCLTLYCSVTRSSVVHWVKVWAVRWPDHLWSIVHWVEVRAVQWFKGMNASVACSRRRRVLGIVHDRTCCNTMNTPTNHTSLAILPLGSSCEVISFPSY